MTKTLATGKFVKTNLQNYASDNLQLSPIKDLYVAISKLILTMGDLLSCIDAIRLNGNVWINIPLRLDKLVSDMTARCERMVKGER